MSRHQILGLKHLPAESAKTTERRFIEHLQKFRYFKVMSDGEATVRKNTDEGEATTAQNENGPSQDTEPHFSVNLTHYDHAKIYRRAKKITECREAASGLAHLRKEDKERLSVLSHGVALVRLPSEHRADEIAAELHVEYPWMAPATEVVWHALRKSVREGWPGVCLPPLLLDGPPGIGKSVWSRQLAKALALPELVIEATSESASFGIVGSQRGWSNAAPGRLVQTILQHRIGNPLVLIDELEKAGTVESSKGRTFDLASSLLPLLEPATARRWTCPFFEVSFDFQYVSWVMTVNSTRPLPKPLLSRCPAIRLPELTTDDLRGFARRQGARRGLSDFSIAVIAEAIEAVGNPSRSVSLRTVMRMIQRAETFEVAPWTH